MNGAGYLAGLSMLIDPRLEDYYAALFSFYGIQVLVHANQDYPEISARGILLSPRKEAFLQASAEFSRLVDIYPLFAATWCFHLQGRRLRYYEKYCLIGCDSVI